MKKILLGTLSVSLLVNGVQGATEFEESVPLALAKIFLNIANAPDVGIYSDIMEEFPEFELPDGFTVLGSLNQGIMQRVVLETGIEREEAGIMLFDALAENGWIELPMPEITQAPRGFVPSGGRQPYGITLNLCHDDLGNMTLSVLDNDDTNLVSLMRTNMALFNGIQPGCEQQIEQQSRARGMGMMMQGGVMEHTPTLRLPDSDDNIMGAPMGFFGGGGGSTNDWEYRSNIAIDWDIDDLFRHFEAQMQEQDWAPDSQWSGAISAGGNWTRTPEEDLDLAATLSIVRNGEENFELKLRVFSLGNRQGGANIRTGLQNVIIRDAAPAIRAVP